MNNFHDQDPHLSDNELLQDKLGSSFHGIAEWLILHGEHTEDAGQENMHIFHRNLSGEAVLRVLIPEEKGGEWTAEGGEVIYQARTTKDEDVTFDDKVTISWMTRHKVFRLFARTRQITIVRFGKGYQASVDEEYWLGRDQQNPERSINIHQRPANPDDATKIEAVAQELFGSSQSS